uniref:Uncharacterized protein n=1 Tax=Helianthus annuus TaxID=4232 RepID=A0A251VNE9_HELAN
MGAGPAPASLGAAPPHRPPHVRPVFTVVKKMNSVNTGRKCVTAHELLKSIQSSIRAQHEAEIPNWFIISVNLDSPSILFRSRSLCNTIVTTRRRKVFVT